MREQTGAEPDIKRVLNSKKVTDHHAIIPTIEITKTDLSAVPEGEMKILSLVANRLLCATGKKQLYETVKAEFFLRWLQLSCIRKNGSAERVERS